MTDNQFFLYPLAKNADQLLITNLISQMEITRNPLLEYIHGLKKDRLDRKVYAHCNTIGGLLKHIAAVEYYYGVLTFQGRELNEIEQQRWHGSLFNELELDLVAGNEIDYYIDLLREVRINTISNLLERDDNWLLQHTTYKYSVPVNNYYCLYHVLEHENVHFGQIRMLITLIKNA